MKWQDAVVAHLIRKLVPALVGAAIGALSAAGLLPREAAECLGAPEAALAPSGSWSSKLAPLPKPAAFSGSQN